MNRYAFIAIAALALAVSCNKDNPKDIPTPDQMFGRDTVTHVDVPDKPDVPSIPIDQIDYPDRQEILTVNDMVLLYGGSHHRNPYTWDKDYMMDYVRYVDPAGVHHWLFDAFLCLEFMWADDPYGTPNKTYITGYSYNGSTLPSADQSDWETLADYYFIEGYNLDALESVIATEAKTIGKPATKRKIVIGIPEPITHKYSSSGTGGSVYWGSVDGKRLDFSVTADRITAVKWYIDRVRAEFLAKNYQYIELAGFYWVAEKATQTRDILASIGDYLKELKYSFNWIPYYTADGYSSWKKLGFSQAFLQPNYFFSESVPYHRLDDAIGDARDASMGLEMEFDGKACASTGWGYRLRDYMKAFEESGVAASCPIAYYQGAWALRWLKNSSSEEDKKLYNEFCNFVVSRPYGK